MLTITKEFKKDLKNADEICFSSNDGHNFLRLHTKNGYSKEITLKKRDYYDYKNSWFHDYTSISGWGALYYIVKPGDKLYFYVESNQQENLTVVGLYNDQLNCKIFRNDKEIVPQFLLGYSICADNSARAIKTN